MGVLILSGFEMPAGCLGTPTLCSSDSQLPHLLYLLLQRHQLITMASQIPPRHPNGLHLQTELPQLAARRQSGLSLSQVISLSLLQKARRLDPHVAPRFSVRECVSISSCHVPAQWSHTSCKSKHHKEEECDCMQVG